MRRVPAQVVVRLLVRKVNDDGAGAHEAVVAQREVVRLDDHGLRLELVRRKQQVAHILLFAVVIIQTLREHLREATAGTTRRRVHLNEAVKVRRKAAVSLLSLAPHTIHDVRDERVGLEHLRVQTAAHAKHASRMERHIVIESAITLLSFDEIGPLSCLIDSLHLVIAQYWLEVRWTFDQRAGSRHINTKLTCVNRQHTRVHSAHLVCVISILIIF